MILHEVFTAGTVNIAHMFVQSAAFVEHHKKTVNEISVYGQEKGSERNLIVEQTLGHSQRAP